MNPCRGALACEESGVKMPLTLSLAAVAVAGAAAAFRPHGEPARNPAALPTAAARFDRALPRPSAEVVVYVTGEVRRPGVYALASGARVNAALRAAAGATEHGDLVAVNLAEPLSDGEKVVVPAKGTRAVEQPLQDPFSAATPGVHERASRRARSSHAKHRRGHKSHKTPPAQPIDVNAADASSLEQLPGIGPSLAERIVQFRNVNGPFHSADELLDVAGMTDRRLDAIDQYIVVR
jgi:competence protein ComEA